MAQFWEQDQVVGAQPAQQPAQGGPSLRPVLTLPDPRADREEARDEARLGLSLEGETDRKAKDQFDRITTYRNEFRTEPVVREFRQVQNATQQIMDLAARDSDKPGPGDIALIFSYMKALDPASVVREGEFATAQNAGGVPETVMNAYNRLLEGGRLSPELKQEFAATAASIYNARLNTYNSYAQDYRGLLEAEGVDPDAQGVRLAEPISFGGIPGVVEPEMVGGVAKGTNTRLAGDSIGEDGISAGQRYLQELGIMPLDEARIGAFWNANRGNEALTPEGVKQWYAQNGYEAALPDDQAIIETIAKAQSGVEFGQSLNMGDMDADYIGQLDTLIQQEGINPEGIGRSAAVGGASGSTLGWNDEIMGGLAAMEELLAGGDVVGAYQANRDMRRRIRERAMEENPGTVLGTELASSFLVPVAGGRNAIARGGQAAVRNATRGGAVMGGVAGAGYGEGTGGTVGGAAAGAALGGLIGNKAERFLRGRRLKNLTNARGNPPVPTTAGGEAVAAADRLNAATGANVRLLPADVSGPGLRNVTGGAAKMTISGELIGRASQRLSNEAEKAKNAIVGLVGGRAEPEVAGERALDGAKKWIKTSRNKVNALYTRARAAGGDDPVDLERARQVLDGHITELSQTPGSAAGLERLKALRAELDSPFPVEGVKRMRTRLRDDFGGDGLRATDIERRVGQVIDAAEDDIFQSLMRAGKPNAARLYGQAAQAHAERVQVIDNVLAPIIGAKGDAPRSGEQILAALEQAGRSNSARLASFMKTLPDEDAGVIRGTIIDRLGRATNGQQDETGAAFSLNTFLTNWSGMSDRAKATMFSGEARAALNDLAKVASARRDSGRYVNFSNTGSSIGNLASGGALAGSIANPAALGLFAIDGLTGAMLSSPKFARWLAKMPEQPGAQRKHIESLSRIAAAEPAIAADALGLQQQLLARFQPGQLPLAAEGQGGSAERQPPTGMQPQ